MRTRAKGNVLDAVSYPMGGASFDNTEQIIGSIATFDALGAGAPAFIVNGDEVYLFPAGRKFVVTGGSNAGSYTVQGSGAVFNTDSTAPHIANTTEIPAAVSTDVSGSDGTISGYGIDLNGTLITNSGTSDGSDITEVANVDYVDNAISGITVGPANLLSSPPDYNIDISGNADTVDGLHGAQFLRSDVSDILQDGTLTIQSTTTQYLSFNDQAGNQNPGILMYVNGGLSAGARIDNVNSDSNGYLRLYRFTSGGGFASQIRLFEDGNIIIDPSGTTTNDGDFNVTGNIVATGNVTAFSDIRLKEDITTIDNAMDKIVQIGGYTFTRNDLDDDKRHVGVIAQEIQQVLPEAVVASKEGMLSVAYGNLVALLIEGMKEQKKEIDDLKKRLDKVEE